jgi:hypothetical protein
VRFTLKNVCAECSGFCSREIEPSLTRDMLEGLDRYRYGLRSPAAFKWAFLQNVSLPRVARLRSQAAKMVYEST